MEKEPTSWTRWKRCFLSKRRKSGNPRSWGSKTGSNQYLEYRALYLIPLPNDVLANTFFYAGVQSSIHHNIMHRRQSAMRPLGPLPLVLPRHYDTGVELEKRRLATGATGTEKPTEIDMS